MIDKKRKVLTAALLTFLAIVLGGCMEGYQNSWIYPDDIETVYVEMFESASFRRGHEYELTDAVCKRIEAQTPYKIVSDRDLADSVLSGYITGIETHVLTGDRYVGAPLEREVIADIRVTWKNLNTGRIIVNNERVSGSASYSTSLKQEQPFEYAANLAVNRAAERVIEAMQTKW